MSLLSLPRVAPRNPKLKVTWYDPSPMSSICVMLGCMAAVRHVRPVLPTLGPVSAFTSKGSAYRPMKACGSAMPALDLHEPDVLRKSILAVRESALFMLLNRLSMRVVSGSNDVAAPGQDNYTTAGLLLAGTRP